VTIRPYVRTSAKTLREGGGEFQDNPTGGRECHLFLARNRVGAFGQPAFFLAGNRTTIVAFEKEVSLKA